MNVKLRQTFACWTASLRPQSFSTLREIFTTPCPTWKNSFDFSQTSYVLNSIPKDQRNRQTVLSLASMLSSFCPNSFCSFMTVSCNDINSFVGYWSVIKEKHCFHCCRNLQHRLQSFSQRQKIRDAPEHKPATKSLNENKITTISMLTAKRCKASLPSPSPSPFRIAFPSQTVGNHLSFSSQSHEHIDPSGPQVWKKIGPSASGKNQLVWKCFLFSENRPLWYHLPTSKWPIISFMLHSKVRSNSILIDWNL